MNVDAFLDTNVIAYTYSKVPAEAAKRERAKAVMRAGTYGISGQVLQELYVVLTRKNYIELTQDEALIVIENLRGTPFVSVDAALVEAGIRMSQRFQISYWDGAILAAAERLGAKTLYSEDLSHGQRYGTVTVENPFADL